MATPNRGAAAWPLDLVDRWHRGYFGYKPPRSPFSFGSCVWWESRSPPPTGNRGSCGGRLARVVRHGNGDVAGDDTSKGPLRAERLSCMPLRRPPLLLLTRKLHGKLLRMDGPIVVLLPLTDVSAAVDPKSEPIGSRCDVGRDGQ
jgi:hypothetical protein